MSDDMNAGDVFGDVQDRPRYKPERPAPEIPLKTFLEAQRDPRVKRFLEEARKESQRFEIHL